jgi:predicted nucleotidyltransferase
VARRAAQVLRRRFGASKVIVFGSLAHEEWFSAWSDIDLAAWGIPPDRFYSAVAAITGLSSAFKVDLVDPETCRPTLRAAMEREGIEL